MGPSIENKTDDPNPQSIFCDVLMIEECWNLVQKLPPLDASGTRVIAFGDHDRPWLTKWEERAISFRDSRQISKVLAVSKDKRIPGVYALPIGLNTLYIQNLYGPEGLLEATRTASLDSKTKSVLAAWGARFERLDDLLMSRQQAKALFTNESCVAPRVMLNKKEYLMEMSKYRFMISPAGNGIFSPKTMEALLVLTIPILQREPDGGAWKDLRDEYGWPVVIVDKWEEVNAANLTRWWKELAPTLHQGRMKLLADPWFDTVMRTPSSS